ncbi:MAG: IS21 family transposase, partial [Rhodovulum sp.]
MPNQLPMAEIQAIMSLYKRGWSCRRIARELGIHRETVGRYVRQSNRKAGLGGGGLSPGVCPEGGSGDGSKPAKAPTGTGGSAEGLPECEAAPGRVDLEAAEGLSADPVGWAEAVPGSLSHCRAFHSAIVAGLEQGLTATRIRQDLLAEHGPSAPGYYSVRRYIKALGDVASPPFRRMHVRPGEEAQVDFGSGALVVDSAGRRRRTHVLRVVLSHSRKGYSEAVYRQTTDAFLCCLENAFAHFGGVPATLVLDNLRAAVSRADWFDPELNPKVQSFCEHYGIAALPTKPRTPRHKGKVERGIAYVKDNALKGRRFESLDDQNRHLWAWEAGVADVRIHGTTKRQVREIFEQAERPALRPLPDLRFPCFQEVQRVVSRDGHIEVAKAYYSAPPEYLGRRLWVRYDTHLVRLFDARMRQIAVHARHEEGRFSTQNRHIVSRKVNSVERGAAYLLRKAGCIGRSAGSWAEAMIRARGVEGVRVLQGLISLAGKHPANRIDRACAIAL